MREFQLHQKALKEGFTVPVTQSLIIDNIDNAANSSTNNEASTSTLLRYKFQNQWQRSSKISKKDNWLFVVRFMINCGLRMASTKLTKNISNCQSPNSQELMRILWWHINVILNL
ncbi:hypothetical protein HZH66_014704 [Vespula vulgaris]|uniref:Uncharacterized protein n=1 Tax=Vespula vulgaris TaxID=7454 RepID=A0A834IYM0_VESVU|nr:hypothetical protein HZH66_014704 [Vespula vulgaris]